MEFEVSKAPFWVYKDCVSGAWVCNSCNFNQTGLKKLFRAVFDEKVLILKYLASFFDKKNSKNNLQNFFCLYN